MGLGITLSDAVVFGVSASSDFERKAGLAETMKERPTCDIDRCCVLKRLTSPSLNAGVAKFCGGPISFLSIASHTGQCEIGNPV